MKHLGFALCSLMLITPFGVKAQDMVPFNQNDEEGSVGSFGGVGLLEMRNARFSKDGELFVGAGYIDGGQNYYATWQATPWLETTLRYSDYDNQIDDIDKSVDVKIRLLEEGNYKPAIAVGLQDFLGDGLFSGEYIVASKKISNFDFTVGFGFGSFAGRAKIYNITRIFGNNFKTRSFSDEGSEKLRFGNYFAGPKMGLYGGVEYKTPIDGLTAKIEYSTVDRSQVLGFEDYKSKTAFNVGLNYKVRDWLEVGTGLLHGNQFMFQIILKQNLHKPVNLGFAKGYEPDEIRVRQLKTVPMNANDFITKDDQDVIFERLRLMGYSVIALELEGDYISLDIERNDEIKADPILILGAVLKSYQKVRLNFKENQQNNIQASRTNEIGQQALKRYEETSFYSREKGVSEMTDMDKVSISRSIASRMMVKDLKPNKVVVDGDEVFIEKEVATFNNIPRNIGRAARILTNEAPDDVERFTIISKDRGLKVSKVSVLRQEFEKSANYNSSPEEILASAVIEKPDEELLTTISYQNYPNIEYGFFPEVQSHFGSDGDHFKADLNAKFFADINLRDDLQVYGEAKQQIIGNLDLLPASTNPNIPHVRSDIGRYSKDGTTSISRLQIEHIKNPIPNIYTRVTFGYLEEMYAGISGEVLYRPYDSSLSFGLDMSYVKQRAFNQLFDLRTYDTFTGHATVYYVNSKYDITTKISAGRYLAQDWGSTIDISREFNNGIRIGVMATFTDMSSSDFGRGSFDKGIYMIIPFDFFWYKQTKQKARYEFRRLGKNGGQKLNLRTDLFDVLSKGQSYKLKNNWQSILD